MFVPRHCSRLFRVVRTSSGVGNPTRFNHGQAAFEPGDEAYVALTLDDSDGLIESDGGIRDCMDRTLEA